jgi:hypothetical protein
MSEKSLICPKCGHDLGESLDFVERASIEHIMNPGPMIPTPTAPICGGCEFAEWRDEEWDYNLCEEGYYWYCKKYYEPLNGTWNDYDAYRCKDCLADNPEEV